jgi:hypothetical protein
VVGNALRLRQKKICLSSSDGSLASQGFVTIRSVKVVSARYEVMKE